MMDSLDFEEEQDEPKPRQPRVVQLQKKQPPTSLFDSDFLAIDKLTSATPRPKKNEIRESSPPLALDMINEPRQSRGYQPQKSRLRTSDSQKTEGSETFSGPMKFPINPSFNPFMTNGVRTQGLGIFPRPTEADIVDSSVVAKFHEGLDANGRWKDSLYDKIKEAALEEARIPMARNGFEEMIQWTKEGKVWKFPIDNEQDIGREASVPFHQHVFINRLTQDFPKAGAVRNFIDLVASGLSRNPYMSVEEKEGYILWYKDYFESKGLMGTVAQDKSVRQD